MAWLKASKSYLKTILALKENGMFKKNRIAMLDTDRSIMEEIKDSIAEKIKRVRVDTYHHPENTEELLEKVDYYNIILINHHLENLNGAFVVRKILVTLPIQADIFIYASNYHNEYNGFKFYLSIDQIKKNPESLLNAEGTSVDRAVESVCLSKINPGKKLAVI